MLLFTLICIVLSNFLLSIELKGNIVCVQFLQYHWSSELESERNISSVIPEHFRWTHTVITVITIYTIADGFKFHFAVSTICAFRALPLIYRLNVCSSMFVQFK